MQEHVYLIADACAQWGVEQVIICPGSRSAPLVYAFSSNPQFTFFSIPDERSAAYMALGMAQQTGKPVVIICTSGTASLNLYPAISEAFYRKIPLVVLTADRPYHLLHQQDGQMINQQNVFEKNICASFSTPDSDDQNALISQTNSLIKQVELIRQQQAGPIHINVPLREPLYPKLIKNHVIKKNSPTHSIQQAPLPVEQIEHLQSAWNNAPRKVILIGQHAIDNTLFTALLPFYQQGDAVILSDVLSNKQSLCTAPQFDFILSHASTETLQLLQPDLVISMGGSFISKALKNWLRNYKPKYHFRIHNGGVLVDTYNHSPIHIAAQPEYFFRLLNQNSDAHLGSACKLLWQQLNTRAEIKLKQFTAQHPEAEISMVQQVLKQLPDGINLHLSNSSSIRYASYCGAFNPSWVMDGNRGTSGIDGSTSTAVGSALVNNRMTVLITGDLGFFYDRNAFFHNHIPENLRVIVINNQGGGIFTLIDGPPSQPQHLKYFTTPHTYSAKYTALEHGLSYFQVNEATALEEALTQFLKPNNKAAVLEIKTDMKDNQKSFTKFKSIKL